MGEGMKSTRVWTICEMGVMAGLALAGGTEACFLELIPSTNIVTAG